jgi:hypothetical protein
MNNYRTKSTDELKFIIKDASEAATCAKDLGNYDAEGKYLDQVNDACTELYRRRRANNEQQMQRQD